MAEFYVTCEWLELEYVAHVSAPRAPERLMFACYEEFRAAMEELGHTWALTCETPNPQYYAFDSLEVWTKQLAHVREFIPHEPTPTRQREPWL
jgi:hypothetical protein